MKIFAETAHFRLREILPSDVDGMYALDSNPQVHRYLGNKPVDSREKSEEYIASIRKQYKKYGIGRWALEHLPSGEFMGWSGLKLNTEHAMNGFSNFYDIGYRLRPEFWGQGYATETSIIARDYAFETLKIDTLYGMAELDHGASRKVLTKIGLQYINDFHCEPYDVMLAWYEMKNPDLRE